MAEYIEREKVYKMLNSLGGCGADPDTWADGWDKAFDEAIRELDNIPAADVRPERLGGWQHNGNGGAVCTCCKGVSDEPFAIYYDYCPNCGAKMDGRDGERG